MEEENVANVNQPRSIESTARSPVTFENKTDLTIEIFWLNFSGEEISYGLLSPQAKKSINTFVTHPWIALHRDNRRRLWLNSKEVFYPPVPRTARVVIGHNREQLMVRRPIILITRPVFRAERLMDLCCSFISNIIRLEDIDQLPLPRVIKKEIRRHYNTS